MEKSYSTGIETTRQGLPRVDRSTITYYFINNFITWFLLPYNPVNSASNGGYSMVSDTVFLFGDSVARGIILDEAGKYTPIRDNFGTLAAAQLGVSLVNKARFGCTITKGLDIMRRFLSGKRATALPTAAKAAEKGEPGEGSGTAGIALLEFGGNDCDFLWDEIAAHPEAEHLPMTPIEEFSRMYGEMIASLRSVGVIPVILTLPPLVAERFFDWVTRNGLNRAAILSWLGDVQQIFRWHESYDKAVRAVADENSCTLLDIRKAFLDSRDYRRYICGDGMHPNREGHRLIEASLMEYALLA